MIAAIGDGAFQMLGINALIDIARYHDRWSNQQLVVLVLHNNDLNQVTWEQRVMSGDPKLEVSQTLPDFPYARYAELLGLKGIRVDAPEQVGAAWDRGAGRRRTGPDRGDHRPRGPAAAAAHPLRAGSGDRARAARRPSPRPDHAQGAQGQDRRARQSLTCGPPSLQRTPVKRWLWNLRAGRMQKTLAATAAASGLPLGLEMYLEHYKGSFGDIWMWSPIVTSPLVSAAGLAGDALVHGGAHGAAGGRGRCTRSTG